VLGWGLGKGWQGLKWAGGKAVDKGSQGLKWVGEKVFARMSKKQIRSEIRAAEKAAGKLIKGKSDEKIARDWIEEVLDRPRPQNAADTVRELARAAQKGNKVAEERLKQIADGKDIKLLEELSRQIADLQRRL
jgi:hypothetical protein